MPMNDLKVTRRRAIAATLGLCCSGASLCDGQAESPKETPKDSPFLVVLGVAQDAGYPQAGCLKDCCQAARSNPKLRRFATSFGIVDPKSRQRWMIECTPNFPGQLSLLDEEAPVRTARGVSAPGLDGILLTHAHIGHYAGLIHLGREVIGAKKTNVFAMPRMASFLRNNGPWGQLVRLEQIVLQSLAADRSRPLNSRIGVTPILVPHRDEYSETVGFLVKGPSRSALVLPDIDKWGRWRTRIEDVLAQVDVAYLDGTFFANGELPGRDMSKIPHPFISESMRRFAPLADEERAKVRFIHFNHTNPALQSDSNAADTIRRRGHQVAVQGERFSL